MATFTINEYIINRKRIGKGSFSSIYKAYNTKNNNIYAIKEIFIDKKQNKSNVKRELNVLKTLDHPNIVKLHDVIIDTNYNNIYFVFDYYPKGDFAKFLNNKPLKEKYSKKYLQQLSNGLEYLLSKNILHRDLKPQNILLTDEFNIKLTDFGFAKQFDQNSLISTLCGSPMYMAPEIINKKDYDNKSDLWSVGIILYQMVYGTVPYNVNNFLDLIKNVNSKEIQYNINDIKVSDNCINLMIGLLTKDPKHRITWEEFFNHKWFYENTLLREENNLLEISISNNSLPNLGNFNINEKQFCSFTYESVIEENDNENIIDISSKIKNENENKNEQLTDDIELTFLESLETSYETTTDYESAEENEDNSKKHNMILSLDNDSKPSEGIDIQKQKKYSIQNFDSRLMKNSLNEYEVIDQFDMKPCSLPVNNKTITESFKEYLYSSIGLIKDSYNYISNNKSI